MEAFCHTVASSIQYKEEWWRSGGGWGNQSLSHCMTKHFHNKDTQVSRTCLIYQLVSSLNHLSICCEDLIYIDFFLFKCLSRTLFAIRTLRQCWIQGSKPVWLWCGTFLNFFLLACKGLMTLITKLVENLGWKNRKSVVKCYLSIAWLQWQKHCWDEQYLRKNSDSNY